MSPSAPSPSVPRADPSEFDRVIAAERRNDDLLREARGEAEALVQAAREDAAARESSFAARLLEAIRARSEALAAERQRRLTEISVDARARTARYDAVAEEQVRSTTDALVDALIARGGPA